jgi:ERCC4-type nuclease
MMIELLPTILIDSREQDPLRFETLPSQVVTLEAGDYGIKGWSIISPVRKSGESKDDFEKREFANRGFVVERKSLPDLCSTLGTGRERFMREVEMLARYQFRALVIEATPDQVEDAQYRSLISPASLISTLDALAVRQGLHIIWCGSHLGAARKVENLARMFIRGIEKQYRRALKYTPDPGPRTKGVLVDKEA